MAGKHKRKTFMMKLTAQLDTQKQPSDNEVVTNTLFEGD